MRKKYGFFRVLADFCGWLTRFIIADTEEEEDQKEFFIQMGSDSGNFAGEMLESAAEKERIRAEREEKLKQILAH